MSSPDPTPPARPLPGSARPLPASKPRRGGGELWTRVVLSTLMFTAIGVIYWLDVTTSTAGRLSAALLGVLGIAGIHEFTVMFKRAGFPVADVSLLLASVALAGSAFAFGWAEVDRELYPIVLVTFALLFPLALRSLTRQRMARGLEEQGATLLGLISIAWPMYLAQGLVLRHPPSALYVVLVCKGGDIGGYLIGSFFGRQKLIPHISAGKTVQGALGSLVASCALAMVLPPLLLAPRMEVGLTVALGVGIILNLTTQIGDLVESLLKRRCGVKDSSALLPAHGGVLDLIDSLLYSFPAFLMIVILLT